MEVGKMYEVVDSTKLSAELKKAVKIPFRVTDVDPRTKVVESIVRVDGMIFDGGFQITPSQFKYFRVVASHVTSNPSSLGVVL